MSFAEIGGAPVEWLDLYLPWSGVWTLRARVDLDGADAIALGATTLRFDDGTESIEYRGTILQSSATDGTGELYAIGGAAGLRKRIVGEDYARPPPRLVVAAILSACGEALGDTSTIDALPLVEPSYQRLAGLADRQLDELARVAGFRWYVQSDGAIACEVPSWPAYQGDAFIVANADSTGLVRAEPSIPNLLPGMTVDGVRIASVRYVLADDGLYAMLGQVPA